MEKNYLILYPKLRVVLQNIAHELQDVLVDNFVGMYIQGSLAIGDFDLSSDVDFIIVVREELSPKQIEEWQLKHKSIYNQDNRWVKRLEYSFFPEKILNKLSSPYPIQLNRDKLWYFDNGSQIVERSDHCNSIVVRWTVREKGIVIFGPYPKVLIDEIPINSLRNEIKNTIIGWGEELIQNPTPFQNRFYQSYLVLNFSRMFHDLHTGQVGSKLAGIKWAKSSLSKKWKNHIDFCWNERKDLNLSINQPSDYKAFIKTIAFVEYIVNESKLYHISP